MDIPLAGPSSPAITLTPGILFAISCSEVKLPLDISLLSKVEMEAGACLISWRKPLALTTISPRFVLFASLLRCEPSTPHKIETLAHIDNAINFAFLKYISFCIFVPLF